MTDSANIPDGKYFEFPKNGNPIYMGGESETSVILTAKDYQSMLTIINKCQSVLIEAEGVANMFKTGSLSVEIEKALAAIEAFRKGEK